VEGDLITVSCRDDTENGIVYLRGNSMFPLGLYYFEITVVELRKENPCFIGIGLSKKDAATVGMCGWEVDSFGYHSDDGNLLENGNKGYAHGEPYSEGETVGCGVDPDTFSMFFTKNGRHVGDVFGLHGAVYPVVTLCGGHAKFKVNFGNRKFFWGGWIV
jgi:Ran-binding protein 9/10